VFPVTTFPHSGYSVNIQKPERSRVQPDAPVLPRLLIFALTCTPVFPAIAL
jgi:hypothetical protein